MTEKTDKPHQLEDLTEVVVSVSDILETIRLNQQDRETPASHCLQLQQPFVGSRTLKRHSIEKEIQQLPEIGKEPLNLKPAIFLDGTYDPRRPVPLLTEYRRPRKGRQKQLFYEDRDLLDKHGEPPAEMPDEYQREWESWWKNSIEEWKSHVRDDLEDEILFGEYHDDDVVSRTVPVRYE